MTYNVAELCGLGKKLIRPLLHCLHREVDGAEPVRMITGQPGSIDFKRYIRSRALPSGRL